MYKIAGVTFFDENDSPEMIFDAYKGIVELNLARDVEMKSDAERQASRDSIMNMVHQSYQKNRVSMAAIRQALNQSIASHAAKIYESHWMDMLNSLEMKPTLMAYNTSFVSNKLLERWLDYHQKYPLTLMDHMARESKIKRAIRMLDELTAIQYLGFKRKCGYNPNHGLSDMSTGLIVQLFPGSWVDRDTDTFWIKYGPCDDLTAVVTLNRALDYWI